MPAIAGRARLEDLWTRWITDGGLAVDEQNELARALAEDEGIRADLLQDQRIDGALSALGRGASEGNAFVRRFAERIAAERDGHGFVSSVERRIIGAQGKPPRRTPTRRWLALPAVAAAVLAVFLLVRGRAPHPAPPAPVAGETELSSPDDELPGPGVRAIAIARIERARGAVFLDGARRIEAQPGTWLLSSWGLMTLGPDSHAVVVFADHTSLELGPDTALLQVGDRAQGIRGKEAFLARGRLTAAVTPQPAGRPMLITTPQVEARVVGTLFSLTVDRRSTRLDVSEGGVQIARVTGGQSLVVRPSQYVVATEGTETALRAERRTLALLLVGNLSLQYDDERIRQRLVSLGFDVRVRGSGPPDPDELSQVAVILVSSSVFSLDLNTQYRDVPVPLMVWEPSLFDDFGMTGPEEHKLCGVAASLGEALIKTPGHPIAAGLDGTVTIITNGRNLHHLWLSFGTPGPAATAVATWPGLPNRSVLFAYERGVAMPGLHAAPARRVGFFFYDDGRLHLTEAGWTLFDGAVSWLAGR